MKTIITVLDFAETLYVPKGTPFESLPLPQTVRVFLDDATHQDVPVLWLGYTFNPNNINVLQMISGMIKDTDSVRNPLNHVVFFQVIVLESISEPTTEIPWIWKLRFIFPTGVKRWHDFFSFIGHNELTAEDFMGHCDYEKQIVYFPRIDFRLVGKYIGILKFKPLIIDEDTQINEKVQLFKAGGITVPTVLAAPHLSVESARYDTQAFTRGLTKTNGTYNIDGDNTLSFQQMTYLYACVYDLKYLCT